MRFFQKTFIDKLVEDELVIELKAGDVLLPVHEAQLITYLKLADKTMGFLLNFNVDLIINGIKRRINGFFEENKNRAFVVNPLTFNFQTFNFQPK